MARLLLLLSIVLFAAACAPKAPAGAGVQTFLPVTSEPVSADIPPDIERWESQMASFGRKHCELLKNHSAPLDPRLAATYYDAQWIYLRIAEHTGDASWRACADAAAKTYRDDYVLKNGGKIPGYWVFPHGLAEDAVRNKNSKSGEALKVLARHAAFCEDSTPAESIQSVDQSREVAYAIMAYLQSERVGEPRRYRLEPLVNQALDHLDQWFEAKNAPYIRPFMVALTSQALIEWHQATGDERVVPALVKAWDNLWESTWVSGAGAFKYTDRAVESGGVEPSPDLNLLIAPVFAWLYLQTGEDRFLERGDQIFRGGVGSAYVTGAKQFNQAYRWSFDYVRWRREGLEKHSPQKT